MVAVKLANKSGQPDAELVEPRAGAKGNTAEHAMRRTPGRTGMSHALDRVRQAAKDIGCDVHRPAAPRRCRIVAVSLWLAAQRSIARRGRGDLGGIRRGPGSQTDRPARPYPPGCLSGGAIGLVYIPKPAAIAFLQEWTRAPPGHSRAGGQSLSPDSIGGSSSARWSKC